MDATASVHWQGDEIKKRKSVKHGRRIQCVDWRIKKSNQRSCPTNLDEHMDFSHNVLKVFESLSHPGSDASCFHGGDVHQSAHPGNHLVWRWRHTQTHVLNVLQCKDFFYGVQWFALSPHSKKAQDWISNLVWGLSVWAKSCKCLWLPPTVQTNSCEGNWELCRCLCLRQLYFVSVNSPANAGNLCRVATLSAGEAGKENEKNNWFIWNLIHAGLVQLVASGILYQ